jgi:undecaprenyl-diphosphatase
MPTRRFYIVNVLSAIIWAPVLIFSGDLLARSLGPENLATKILGITVLVVILALIGPTVWRRFAPK